MVIRTITRLENKAKQLIEGKEESEEPTETTPPSKEEILLTEIRDLLKEKSLKN
jgi:large-conductance mechanosensitive channel